MRKNSEILRLICFGAGIFLSAFPALAQSDSVLTLPQAIELSLKNNFDIRIASNTEQQAKNNSNPGTAGMLPSVSAEGNLQRTVTNLHQKYSSGLEVDRSNAGSDNLNGNISLDWTIFDGMQMFTTMKKLRELSAQGTEAFKIQVENSIEEITAAYCEIIRQKQLLKSTQEQLVLAEERLKIADRKLANGSGSRLEFLQVRTDRNTQQVKAQQQSTALSAARAALNRLLSRPVETAFVTVDTFPAPSARTLEGIRANLEKQNHTLAYYRQSQNISNLSLQQLQGKRWPVISLNGGYLYTKLDNDAGFTLQNRNSGYTYGITATLPIFNGFRLNTEIKNARLDYQNAQLEYEQIRQSTEETLFVAFRQFSDNIDILNLNELNYTDAKEIMHIAQERYRVGASNFLELKEAEQILEEAITNVVNSRYDVKVSETKLQRLNGELIQ